MVRRWDLEERDPKEEKDPHERKRIRGKMDEKTLLEKGSIVRIRRLQKAIEEEKQKVENEEPDAIPVVLKGIQRMEEQLAAEGKGGEAVEIKEILQTKIVSHKEVDENWESWNPAVESEVRH